MITITIQKIEREAKIEGAPHGGYVGSIMGAGVQMFDKAITVNDDDYAAFLEILEKMKGRALQLAAVHGEKVWLEEKEFTKEKL